MSGSGHLATNAAANKQINVTIGTASPSFGFVNAIYGSVSPSTIDGVTITEARSTTGFDFRLVMPSDIKFSRLLVLCTDGTWRNLALADATVVGNQWTWGSGSNRCWTAIGSGIIQVFK